MSLAGGAQTGPRLRSSFGTSFEARSNFVLPTPTLALSAKTPTFRAFAAFFFRPPSTTCSTNSTKQVKESRFLQCGAPIGATGRSSSSRPTGLKVAPLRLVAETTHFAVCAGNEVIARTAQALRDHSGRRRGRRRHVAHHRRVRRRLSLPCDQFRPCAAARRR